MILPSGSGSTGRTDLTLLNRLIPGWGLTAAPARVSILFLIFVEQSVVYVAGNPSCLSCTWNQMKKRFIIALIVVVALALISAVLAMYERTKVAMIVDDERAWDLRDASPQMKVIVTEGGMVARYLTEDEDNYIGDIQDSVWIPKSRAMVETWYASDGRGIVFLKEFGQTPAYAEPDSTSSVVGKLISEEGDCPCTYDCLELKDGWFRIRISGTEGYINEEYVLWDAIDTF